MVQINKKGNKKGIVITFVTLFMALPLLFMAMSYSEKHSANDEIGILAAEADKLNFIAADAAKNAYSDLLTVNLNSISRNSYASLSFNQAVLLPNANYAAAAKSYRDFIETDYAYMSNVNIEMNGFNTTFKILPYNTTFDINGTALKLFTMPASTNYINSIIISVKLNSSFDDDGEPVGKQGDAQKLCQSPANDAQGNPTVQVTYVDKNGFSCTQSRSLEPTQDNDKGNGKQFYVPLINPSGSLETKYGEISNIDGVLRIVTANATANVTQLDIQYTLMNERIVLSGGNISISTPSFSMNSKIILAEE